MEKTLKIKPSKPVLKTLQTNFIKLVKSASFIDASGLQKIIAVSPSLLTSDIEKAIADAERVISSSPLAHAITLLKDTDLLAGISQPLRLT